YQRSAKGASTQCFTAPLVAARAAVHGNADQLRASGSLQRGRAIHGQRSGSLKGGHRHRALVLLLGLRVHAGSGRLDRRSLRNEARVLAWLSVLVVGRGADCFWQKCGGANRLASSDWRRAGDHFSGQRARGRKLFSASRSEEHTSELQSRFDLVCRLLLEKKK